MAHRAHTGWATIYVRAFPLHKIKPTQLCFISVGGHWDLGFDAPNNDYEVLFVG